MHGSEREDRDGVRAGVRGRSESEGRADHSNEVVLEGQDEGGAVHAGEQGEGEPQQHPLDLLLPHTQGLSAVQVQRGRPGGHGHSMHLQTPTPLSHPLELVCWLTKSQHVAAQSVVSDGLGCLEDPLPDQSPSTLCTSRTFGAAT